MPTFMPASPFSPCPAKEREREATERGAVNTRRNQASSTFVTARAKEEVAKEGERVKRANPGLQGELAPDGSVVPA